MSIVRRVERAVGCKAVSMASAAALLCSCSLAFAEPDSSSSKEIEAARQKYIEKLEARIRSLEIKEERFRALEKKIEILGSKLASRDSGPDWRGPIVSARGNSPPKSANGTDRKSTTTSAGATTANADANAGESSTAASQQSNATAPATPAALAEQEDANALRDLTVIRDQAVTVKQGGVDVGLNFKYVRASSYQQFSRAIIGTGTIRYGVLPGVEASFNVPAYLATRTTTSYLPTPTGAAGIDETTKNIKAMGDISGQVTASLFKETIDWPGVFGYVAVTAPTGPNPYWGGPIPDPFYFTQSSGHWNGTVGVTFVKTLEPIIMFGGVSYTHFLQRDFTPWVMQPADRYGYTLGFGLAVSERTMIGASVQGIYQQKAVTSGIPLIGTSSEAVILNFSLSQRIAMGFFFEPSVAIGMTSDAPSATLTVGARKSF